MSVSDERLAELLDADEYDAEITMAEIMVMARELQALRQLLTDWTLAVEAQRATGESMIRNGVEHRMFARGTELLRPIGPLPGEA